jgi:hypothetical protein
MDWRLCDCDSFGATRLLAAIITGLAAGAYTAIVRGVNNTTGIAVVEATCPAESLCTGKAILGLKLETASQIRKSQCPNDRGEQHSLAMKDEPLFPAQTLLLSTDPVRSGGLQPTIGRIRELLKSALIVAPRLWVATEGREQPERHARHRL